MGIAFRLALGLALALLVSPVVLAQEFVDADALDELFAELRVAPDETTARTIDRRIWAYWTSPTDPELAGRMNEVLTARSMGDPLEAILLLNRLIDDYPGYAEAWNQRATMYYMVGNFEASIADCEKVLELEPRHFGALSGRAMMYLQQGKRARPQGHGDCARNSSLPDGTPAVSRVAARDHPHLTRILSAASYMRSPSREMP